MSPAPAAPPVPASVSLFDLTADAPLLRGLSLVSQAPEEAMVRPLPTSCPDSGKKASPEKKVLQGPLDISEKLFCSACNQSFQNHQEQREHYKLDWHRFNLKQRLKDKPLLSALDFEKQSCTGDLSSISGSEESDSASEEDLPTLGKERAECERPNRPQGFFPHRVLFQNAQGQFLHAYRCVLGPHQVPPDDAKLLLQSLQNGGRRHCVVLMAAAGHFAAGIFQGRDVVTHKTFHRYTVRAKRGSAQGLRDAQGRPSRSAGANLRRYNEASLYKDVRDLLTGPGWAEALQEASIVLLRAPRSGRSLFFGGHGAPLQREDPRLWDIPLTTRRPTFRELQRVFHKLTTLHVYENSPETVRLHSPQTHWKTMRKERQKPTEEERKRVSSSENEELGRNGKSSKQGSGSEDEDGSQVELELVELTLGTLDFREFEVLPKRRKRKRNKKEKTQDHDVGAHMTVNQQPQEDEPVSSAQSAQVVAAPLGSSVEVSEAPGELELWDILLAACRAGDIGQLKLQLSAGVADTELMSLLSAPMGSGGFTLLHAAAAAGRGAVVRLLLEAGADPTVQDSRARPPYTVAADKSTRNEFRRFMGKNPDAYDYDKAQVPGPLTPEMEARQATRKREQKAARRQREEQQRKQQEQEERSEPAPLEDRAAQPRSLGPSVRRAHLQATGHLGPEVAEMRKRQQSQNEGTPAVSQAPGNQRPNNTCCFCWCCCCSCSCLTVRNEERGESTGRPVHTTKMESIQVLEESQSPTADEVLSWSQSFDKMMKAPAGRNLFREFLRTEYSEENLLFWLACEDLKKEQNKKVIEEKARMIYEDYISILSPKEVSLDSRVREVINRNLLDPNPHMYEDAQLQIYTLMHRDSFPRFLNSQIYKSFVESTAGSSSES